MVTATMPARSNGAAFAAPSGKRQSELWGDVEIPVIVGTGEHESGKTLFGLTICPGEQTLVYDWEGSSRTYRSIGFAHVDIAEEMAKKFGTKRYTAMDRYLWWRDDIFERAQSGRYRVGMIDPTSELEDGIAEYVRKHVGEFDLTLAQIQKSSGLFWGAMKKEWKFILERLRPYFDTLYLTVHLRDQFVGNAPSGKREPKGKETLMELASLALWFDRSPGPDGKKPLAPAANVLKSRLCKMHFDPETGKLDVVPVVPPRLPVATPAAIRKYIESPPNYEKLKKEERYHERGMTEEEKLRLQAQIAADSRAAGEIELQKLEQMRRAAEAQMAAAAAMPQVPDQANTLAQDRAAKSQAAAADANRPITAETVARIQKALGDCFGSDVAELRGYLSAKLAEFGVAQVSKLTQSQGESLEIDIVTLQAQRKAAEAEAKAAELKATPYEADARREMQQAAARQQSQPQAEAAEEPPFDPTPEHSPGPVAPPQAVESQPAENPNASCTPQQVEEIKALLPQIHEDGNHCAAFLRAEVAKHGAGKITDLTAAQASLVIGAMKVAIQERQALAADDQPETASREQIERIRELANRLNWDADKQQAYLANLRIGSFRSMSKRQAEACISYLLGIELGFKNPAEGMPANFT